MKNRLVNLLGIAAALAVAAGSLLLTEYLLEEKQEMYLSGGSGLDQTGLVLEAGQQKEPGYSLTKEELKEVLKNMKGREEYPHEPLEGQLSMEQAVERSKEWTEEFAGRYLQLAVPKRQEYMSISAKLYRKQNEDVSNILYSYWMVTLTGKDLGIKLIMNAVSGQVLDARIAFAAEEFEDEKERYACMADISEEAAAEMLEAYAASFGFLEDSSPILGDHGIWQSLDKQNELSAVLAANSVVAVKGSDGEGYSVVERGRFENLVHLYINNAVVTYEKQ